MNLHHACTQCSDIFFLKADICQLGMDQRKVRDTARVHVCVCVCVCVCWLGEEGEVAAARGEGLVGCNEPSMLTHTG